jgi:hypothetical protein
MIYPEPAKVKRKGSGSLKMKDLVPESRLSIARAAGSGRHRAAPPGQWHCSNAPQGPIRTAATAAKLPEARTSQPRHVCNPEAVSCLGEGMLGRLPQGRGGARLRPRSPTPTAGRSRRPPLAWRTPPAGPGGSARPSSSRLLLPVTLYTKDETARPRLVARKGSSDGISNKEGPVRMPLGNVSLDVLNRGIYKLLSGCPSRWTCSHARD